MHVLTPDVFAILDDLVANDTRERGLIQLTTAMNQLITRESYLALETRGARYNLGVKFGVVEAQIALSMAGNDREQLLAVLLESVAKLQRAARETESAEGRVS
jgi:UTP--glucose-1-phosphate uridylyltransferase